MADWVDIGGGWRTWRTVQTAARWRYLPNGDLEAFSVDGKALDVSAAPYADPATLARAAAQLPAIAQLAPHPWYVRALLGLGLHETRFVPLPVYGDCYLKSDPKRLVRCGSEGAAPPRSSGWYALLKSTAQDQGIAWDALATSPAENHRGGLKLATYWEDKHAHDFVALAARWQAGSIKPNPTRDFGVHTWAPDTLTKYARAWNAAGVLLRSKSQAPRPGGELDAGEGLALLVLAWRLLS